jgi:S1-C subfamily serine protease
MRILASASVALLTASTLTVAPPAPGGDPVPAPVTAAFGAVVSVRVHEVVKVPVFRNGRFLREPVEGLGAGSGVVVSEDGLILTNAHVVADGTRVDIVTTDGRNLSASVVSLDQASDLALLKVSGSGPFRFVPFADDTLPEPGTRLYVLGNPGDQGPQIAWARMGAHRALRVGARPLEFWSEIEAPIGPGNSGGAVLDVSGRLVGLPSLLVTYSEEASRHTDTHASGLFIPARHARRAMKRMLAGARAEWPWIGLLLDDPLLAAGEGRAWSPAAGVRARRVFPGSPAAEAGLLAGDRIVAVGAAATGNYVTALDTVLDLAIGEKTTITVERENKTLTLPIVPAARPADPRPDPLDDFALHTGFRLQSRTAGRESRSTLALAGMTSFTRRDLPEFEANLFDERPALVSILPGQNALAGMTRRLPVPSLEDLSTIMELCFVEEQFVALAHWDFGSGKALDRAHVHRKIYPVVL